MLFTISLLTIFAIGMAMVESSVVVYLRELLHDDASVSISSTIGSDLETARAYVDIIPEEIISVEIWREVATILMLASLALVVGKSPKGIVAAFLWTFAVWDIFYYVFLYAIAGWPQSLLTIDLLFLIPYAWFAPVIVPIGVSLATLLAVGFFYWASYRKGRQVFRR
jgi:hypothetical protein